MESKVRRSTGQPADEENGSIHPDITIIQSARKKKAGMRRRGNLEVV
jgi:hypothetical protein